MSFVLMAFLVRAQIGKPFLMDMFFTSFFMSFILGFFLFHFLRLNLCPIIQIYKNELIISQYRRFVIKLQDIKKFRAFENMVELSFSKDGQNKSLTFNVKKNNDFPLICIANGVVEVNRCQ